MRTLLTSLLICVCNFFSFCQSIESFKDQTTGFIGFKNANGAILIEAQFQKWNGISEGMLLVEKNNKWGYCDLKGNMVIPLKYSSLAFFNEGLAVAAINEGEYGYIDKTGKEVIPFKYSAARFFREGWAPVKMGDNFGYIDRKGNTVIAARYELAFSFKEGMAAIKANDSWGFIDRTGKEICAIKYASGRDFSEGLAVVSVEDKYTFINKSGKEIIAPLYDYMNNFSEGLAIVKLDGKYSFINRTGKQIIEPVYNYIDDFKEGFARVKLHGRYGFIDKNGKTILEPLYVNVIDFSEGFARVEIKTDVICKTGFRYSYINSKGDFITDKLYYSSRSEDFNDGFAIVDHCYYGTKGVINKKGNEIIKAIYSSISLNSGIFTAVDENGKAFKFDTLGNAVTVVPPGDYFSSLDAEYNAAVEQVFSRIDFDRGYFYDSVNIKTLNNYLGLAKDLAALQTYVDRLLRKAAKNKKAYQDFSAYLYNKYLKPTPACYKAISIHIAVDHFCNAAAPWGGAYWIDKIQLDEICDRAKKASIIACK